MKLLPYTTRKGHKFSASQIAEIVDRIKSDHDWQRVINDDIYYKVECCDETAWEVYTHCEALMEEEML